MNMNTPAPIIERCAAAFAEHRSIEHAYAVVKADAHFALCRYAQLDVDVNCGWPSLWNTSDLGLAHSLLPESLPCEDPAYKYLLLISTVENHDHDAMRAFFDSVKQFFAYRSSTPQRNGSRVHELWMYPAIIPESSDCDECFREKERRYFQARFRREVKEHPERQGAEILRNTDNGFSVWFFSGLPGTQPHFRVYDNAEAEYAAQSAAVSLHEACYLPYDDTSGKAPYCLPKRHRRKLMKLLQTPLPAGGLTHYEWMLRLANEARPVGTTLPSDRALPNYMYLPEEAPRHAEMPPDSKSYPRSYNEKLI